MTDSPSTEPQEVELWRKVEVQFAVELDQALETARVSDERPICESEHVNASDLAWGFMKRWRSERRPTYWQGIGWDKVFQHRCRRVDLTWTLACEARADWREPTRADRQPDPERCFERVHGHLNESLERALYRESKQEQEAQDLSLFAWGQFWRTHLRDHERTRRFLAVSTLLSWLRTAGIHELAKRRKKQRRERPLDEAIESTLTDSDPGDESTLGPGIRKLVAECIRNLPGRPGRRQLVLGLYLLKKMRKADIAKEMKVGRSAVSNHLKPGLAAIRDCLRKSGVDLLNDDGTEP